LLQDKARRSSIDTINLHSPIANLEPIEGIHLDDRERIIPQ